jgi:hypothetical protein
MATKLYLRMETNCQWCRGAMCTTERGVRYCNHCDVGHPALGCGRCSDLAAANARWRATER